MPYLFFFLYSLHATKYTISCLSRLKLCYWELPPPFCLRVTFHHYLKCASTHGAGAAGGGPGSVPIASQQKQLCQTQLAASEGETPLSTVILQLFTSCPCLCLSHLINPHSNKGKQTPAPTKQRPALLCWHGVCAKAPAQGGERFAGQTELHLQKVIALEPSGALLWWDFFFFFPQLC